MASTATSPKALKRALKELKTREQLASTWLVRIGLFLALAAWAYDEYYSSRAASTTRSRSKETQGAAKQLLLYVGGAMGVVKLALRWYFTRERRELEERTLEDEGSERQSGRSKGSRKRR
ncbi:hypothetical protein JCM3775_000212 [Rhodotorula graminis]